MFVTVENTGFILNNIKAKDIKARFIQYNFNIKKRR